MLSSKIAFHDIRTKDRASQSKYRFQIITLLQSTNKIIKCIDLLILMSTEHLSENKL